MKVLVIPDIHLKPQMFKFDIVLYEKTYDEAISFAKKFPKTTWCHGNHDLSYLWHCPES